MRLAPAQLNEWLQYEHRNTTAGQMQTWVSSEDHQLHLAAQQGFELVIDPADLPDDEATGESWCPKHEMLFESCSCIGPNEQHVVYAEVDGHLMGKPMAMHAFKFPQRDIPESDLQHTYIGHPCTLDDMAAALKP